LNTDQVFNYYKFVKLVPHIFIDKMESGHERDYQTWSYSLTSNKKESAAIYTQNVQITFEFSPLTMQISRSSK